MASDDNFRLLKTEDEEGKSIHRRTPSSYSNYSDPGVLVEPVALNEASSLSCFINLTNTIIGSGLGALLS